MSPPCVPARLGVAPPPDEAVAPSHKIPLGGTVSVSNDLQYFPTSRARQRSSKPSLSLSAGGLSGLTASILMGASSETRNAAGDNGNRDLVPDVDDLGSGAAGIEWVEIALVLAVGRRHQSARSAGARSRSCEHVLLPAGRPEPVRSGNSRPGVETAT